MNTQEPTVGLGKRLGARIVDGLVVMPIFLVAYVLVLVTDGGVAAIVGILLYLVALAVAVYNQIVRIGQRGQSLGKQLLGIRVTDQDTGAPIGIGRAFGRDFVFGLLFAACWIPGIVNIFVTAKDSRRQGWHDKVAGSVVVPAVASETVGAQPEPAAQPAPSTPSLATGAPSPSPSPAPYAPAAPPTAPAPAAGEEHPPPAAETIMARPAPVPDAAAPTSPPPIIGPPPGVAPPPPSPEPEQPAAAPADDGASGDDVGSGWTLTTAAGERLVVEGLVLVGRDPDPSLVAEAEVWVLDDPDLSVSKTHALLGLEDGTAWVEDWHSTNGVALVRGVAELELEPHARTPLRDGDVIEFGAFKVSVERRS